MIALKQKQSKAETSQRKIKLRWDVLFSDLSLLMSLWLARFIVWRSLRQRRKERAERRKQLRLIKCGDHQADERVLPSSNY